MLITSASLAAIAVAAIGFLIFWSNPHRTINRLFFSFSLHLTAWLICVHEGVSHGEDLRWVRLASSFGAFMPFHMWLLKELSFGNNRHWPLLLRRSLWRLGASLLLVGVCLSPWYIVPAGVDGPRPHFGIGAYCYMAGFFTLFAILARETLLQLREQSGIARLELQILFLGSITALIALVGLMALRAVLNAVWPIHLQPIVLLALYSATVVAITTHRIFDARQVVFVATEKLILVLVAAAVAYSSDKVLGFVGIPEAFAYLATVGIALWMVSLVSGPLQKVFRFYSEATVARQAAFAAARSTRNEELESRFSAILKGWGKSESTLIVSGSKDYLRGEGIELKGDSVLVATMRKMRWVTPERLSRERRSHERDQVGRFLKQHGLAALVCSEGPVLTVLVGIGPNAARLPFTYPQITQLVELASIVEGAFERAHFSQKVQHTEQLATVGLLGASVAHEIRNPLVTIKTFVQLLPAHYQDANFREKFFRLISDEVERIDRLTEQLLDLASPRTYSATDVELHSVLRETVDLVATKAAHKQVQLVVDLTAAPDSVHTDAAAAKQVLLNLCFNAIQALDGKDDGPRCIWVGTRNKESGVEVAVADNGPGIAPEMLPRLFQPFQTTKSSGFGLGLAICSDILANLNASITVDPPVPGQGATFRVTFPCQPSSS